MSEEEVIYTDLKFQDSRKKESAQEFVISGIKGPPVPPRAWQCSVVTLTLVCLLLLIGLGVLGSMFYITFNTQVGKLNNLQNFQEELQRNFSLQLMLNMNSSVIMRNLSRELQEVATKLCYQLYSKNPEHKCKPCPKKWLWHEDSCYLQSDKLQTWKTSEMECRALNASLLKIQSKTEFNFIKSQHMSGFWLGLSPTKTERIVKKFDETIISSDWYINNKNDFSDEMYCGYIYKEYLYHEHCLRLKKFTCEKLANPVKIKSTLMNNEPDGIIW